MSLRWIIYSQLLLIAVMGAGVRGQIWLPDGRITDLLIILTILGCPILLFIALYKSKLSGFRMAILLLIQAALTFAYCVALAPGFQ